MSTTGNYSFWAIPAAWGLTLAPHFYAQYLTRVNADLPGFDPVEPREYDEKVRKLDKPAGKRFLRARAAEANGYENMTFLSSAIILGNIAGLPVSLMNQFSAFYLATRALYTMLYINTTQPKYAGLRSLTYTVGIISCFNVIIRAGNRINQFLN